MPLPIGLEIIFSLPSFFISEKSLAGRSKEMSASPRSISARRLPEEGMVRQMTFLSSGSLPPTQASLRS